LRFARRVIVMRTMSSSRSTRGAPSLLMARPHHVRPRLGNASCGGHLGTDAVCSGNP
jgi:hypothetical protein